MFASGNAKVNTVRKTVHDAAADARPYLLEPQWIGADFRDRLIEFFQKLVTEFNSLCSVIMRSIGNIAVRQRSNFEIHCSDSRISASPDRKESA